jgi:hypothetical protein
MESLPKPDVILTHESDLDGLLSGLLCLDLARLLFNITPPLQSYHNHNWRQRLPLEHAGWICDLAFEPRLDRPHWVIIDHHPFDTPPQHAQLIHHPEKSAALLTYELCRKHGLQSPTLDRLVELSDIADLFLVDHPDFELANDYASLVKSYGFWNLHRLLDARPEALLDHPLLEVMRVKRRVEDPIGFAWSRQHITPLSPEIGLVETLVGNTNLIVHQLLDLPDLPFRVLITLYRRGNGTFLASFRSRNEEALPIAARLQGGGHPNASGAPLPRSIQSLADAITYLRQILSPTSTPPPPTEPNSLSALFRDANF